MIVTNLQTLVVTFTANVSPYIAGIQSVLTSNAMVNSAVAATASGLNRAGAFAAKSVQAAATASWNLAKSTAMSIDALATTAANTFLKYRPALASFYLQWTASSVRLGQSLLRLGTSAYTGLVRGAMRMSATLGSIYARLPSPARFLVGGYNLVQASMMGLVRTATAAIPVFTRMTMALGAGTLRGISAGLAAISTSIANMVQSTYMFGMSWINAGKHIRAAGKLMALYITAPLMLIGVMSVNAFGKFDQAMTETFARMGRQSAEVRDQMEGLAMSLSTKGTVAFSPIDLAKGYEELAAAGLNASQSMAVLEDVAILAQAGMFDIDVAVKQLVGSMASFGAMSNDPIVFSANLKRFSDVMVGVANTTTTGVEEVARAMSADGAVAAKNYGMAIEELGAVLGVYAMQNKDAEEAGHLTGRAIRLMTASFQRQGPTWKKFGIDIVDKSTGQYIKFSSAIGKIEKAMKGMTGPMRTAFLDLLGFETLAQKSILPLIGQSQELIRQEELYKKVGAAEEMAAIQMGSFKNQMKLLWNTMQVVGIEVGKILAPYVYKLTKYIADGVAYWRTWSKESKSTSIAIGMVTATIGPMLVGISVATSLIGYLFVGLSRLGTGFRVFMYATPQILIAVAAIAILYKMFQMVVQEMGGASNVWDTFKASTMQMYSQVSVIFVELYRLWEVVTTGFADVALYAFQSILATASAWSGMMMTWSGLTWSSAISWIAEWVRFARFSFQNIGMIAAYMYTRLLLGGTVFMAEMYHMFTVALPAVFSWLGQNWSDVLHTMFDLATTIFINLVTNLGKIFSNLPGLIAGTQTFEKLWTPLTEGFVNTIKKLPEIAPRVVGATEQQLIDETQSQEKQIAEAYAGMVNTDMINAQNKKDQEAIAAEAAKNAGKTGDDILKEAASLGKGKLPGEDGEGGPDLPPGDMAKTETSVDNVARNSNEALQRIMAYQEAGPGMPQGKTIGLDGSISDPTSRATTATDAALSASQEKDDLDAVQRRIDDKIAKVLAILLKFQGDNSKPVDTTLLPADL